MILFDTLVTNVLLLWKSLERRNTRWIFGDGISGGAPMYSSVGVQASRFGGVVNCTPRFSLLSDDHWRTIIKMAQKAKSALESSADSTVLWQLDATKNVVEFMTLSTSNSHHCMKYFGAMVFGHNVFLWCYTDEDFTMSVTQVYLNGSDQYAANDRVVVYLCFPTTCGVAIPMMPHFPTASHCDVIIKTTSCVCLFI